jgi:hypothetical protein
LSLLANSATDLFNNKAFQVVQNDLSTKNAVRRILLPC